MTVEVLFFDGCPGLSELLPRLREMVSEETQLELRRVASPEDAETQRFLGSPSVRVDGDDVEPGAAERTDFGLKCRLYRSADGLAHAPSDELLRRALASGG